MRAKRSIPGRSGPARSRWGNWLSLVALTLNALVPVHLAIDLGEALSPRSVQLAGSDWHVLALVTGQIDRPGKSGDDHKGRPTDCAVCNSLRTLAAAVPVMLAPLPAPMTVGEAAIEAPPEGEPVEAPATGYRSRAPPGS
jgi:DUF2946 family protein